MESKIEQIDLGSTEWELSDALRKYKPEVMAKVLDKMVEIIDHLNSQDQEEEKYKILKEARLYPERTLGKLIKETLEDTPEQKEEWVEIKKKLNGISVEYNIIDRIDVIWEEIENLLSEREVFTKDELFMLKLATNDIHNKGNGAYDEIGEKIERMLSKLNKKK